MSQRELPTKPAGTRLAGLAKYSTSESRQTEILQISAILPACPERAMRVEWSNRNPKNSAKYVAIRSRGARPLSIYREDFPGANGGNRDLLRIGERRRPPGRKRSKRQCPSLPPQPRDYGRRKLQDPRIQAPRSQGVFALLFIFLLIFLLIFLFLIPRFE
jgi:hypothetical protein